MFLGRAWRKKRALSLLQLRTPEAPRRAVMSWRPPAHNAPGVERNWYESVFRSHAASCGCGNFVHHLTTLADRYGFVPGPAPPGGPGPRPAALRALPQPPADNPRPALPWRGDGGGDEGAGGPAADGGPGDAEGDYAQDELDALFDAVEQE